MAYSYSYPYAVLGGAIPNYGYPVAPAVAPAPAPKPAAAGHVHVEDHAHGTIVPFPNFNALADAEALRKAMKGFGTDEKAIIQVLGNRSAAQRLEIAKAFKGAYGKDLIEDLKSELTGHFEDIIVALCQERPVYEAHSLRKAMKGVGTADHVLVELLCTRTNDEIKAVKKAYADVLHRDLEADVAGETSGYFKRILVSVLQAARPETTQVNQEKARADAKALYEAGEKRFGTDESTFNAILMSRSFAELRVIFHEFFQLANIDILTSIGREMSGDVKNAFAAIAHSVVDRPGYFADVLYKAMHGAGTDDDTLIRVIVTRSEIDLADIKKAFAAKYGKTLATKITSETSGDYKKILLEIIGD